MTLFDTSICAHGRPSGEGCPSCSLAPFQGHSVTSLGASVAIEPDRVTLRERVYRCILALGPVTDEGIADALEMNPSTQRPRRVELQAAGRIFKQGTKLTRSGRSAAAWVAR